MTPDIEIKCPKCSGKAAFFSEKTVRWTRIVPSLDGKVACGNCGLNGPHLFRTSDYWYSILVGDRDLYARTFKDLEKLLDYFKMDERMTGDPELDFPKEFYQNRSAIIDQIEKRIKEEKALANKS